MPTISDVAKHAGVSPATVSHVIQGAQNEHSATRDRVEFAIEELGHVSSVAAQSLLSKRHHSLTFVVSDITNPSWTTIARGAKDEAQRQGYEAHPPNDPGLVRRGEYRARSGEEPAPQLLDEGLSPSATLSSTLSRSLSASLWKG